MQPKIVVPHLNLEVKDAAYIAGLFDGEGCINCSWGSKPYFSIKGQQRVIRHFPELQFVITNKSDLLLEIVKNQIGYGNFNKCSKGHVYDYRIARREEILAIIKVLLPYVKLKRTSLYIAKEALEYHINRGHGAWSSEQKIFFYETYMSKLEKTMPMGRRRGRPSKYTLSERFYDTPKFLKKN